MTGNMKDQMMFLSQVEIWDILVRTLLILPVEEGKKTKTEHSNQKVSNLQHNFHATSPSM